MTPTDLCRQMNAVYDALETAGPAQLLALYKEARIRALRGDKDAERFMAQLWYEVTARRRRT